MMNGLHEEYYGDGKLKEKGVLLDGKRNGLWEFYNEDGHLTEKVKYINEFEFWEIFFESGEKRKFLMKNDLVEGVLENYYKTNLIEEKRYFKHDIEYLKESFFENGQLFTRGPILEGKRDGVWETYYKNGELYDLGEYVLGMKKGIWETFYENGQLKSKGNFSDGDKDGVWEKFDEEGHLKEKGNYSNNEKDGIWEIHYGSWVLKGRYQDGYRVGIWESFQNDKIQDLINYDEEPHKSLNRV